MASGDILDLKGTTKVLKASGGDAVWTPQNISSGAGRLSARLDLGAMTSGRSTSFNVYAQCVCQATPTLKAVSRLFWIPWTDDATPGNPDGGISSSDAAFATEAKSSNFRPLFNLVVDAATASVIFSKSAHIYIPYRYISVMIWNITGATFTNTAADHFATFEPTYKQVAA